ncbi:MAG: hypothetical protein R2800_13545 [Flavipsychrobacter sp.]
MKLYANYILLVVSLLLTFGAEAQMDNSGQLYYTHNIGKTKKVYFGNDFDGAIISTAIQSNSLGNPAVGTPRFTYFFHLGFNMHVDVSNSVGLYTGIGVKNIGFIEKTSRTAIPFNTAKDSTIKRRVYTVGLPLGLKIGNLKKRNYVIVGGGVDFPINYREKGFVKRNDKDKFNEWFSDRTAKVMPYVFAGFSVDPGIIFKVQYYPTNFMNPNYVQANTNFISPLVVTTPYAAYDIQLLLFSIGFDIHYRNKVKLKKKDMSIGTM